MGYVGFSVAFAFAIAALLSGRLDSAFTRFARPWTLAAWVFLTLGHRARLGVGLLRAGLGRLVVLGPGGERLLYAVAGGYRPAALAGGHRTARRLQGVDAAAVHLRLLAVPAGHLPGALRGAGVGARLRLRPGARNVYPRLYGAGHRRLAAAVRRARAQGAFAG